MKTSESAGGVVVNRRGQVLVVNQDGRSWSLPKGHLDPGEDELAAARREVLEETGVGELELVRKLGTYERGRIHSPGERKRLTFFLFRTAQEELKPADPRHPEARWVDKERVAELLTHPKDKDFYLQKALPCL